MVPTRSSVSLPTLLIVLAACCLLVGLAQAGIYGNRIDKHGSRIRWLTVIQPDQGADYEIPGHGRVNVRVEGEELVIHSYGESGADVEHPLPRSLVVRGVVVNQLRIGFEK